MKLNSIDLKTVLRLVIANNLELGKAGEFTCSLGVSGTPGIGKTSSIRQVATEVKMPFIKLSLAQNTVEDIVGFPYIEHMVCRGEGDTLECNWIHEKAVQQYISDGWHVPGQSRTNWAVPKWLAPYHNTDQPVILCLDDFNRGSGALIAACMEICEEQTYVSWTLPAGSTVITSSNPDDGENLVSATDEAQASRKLEYEMKFDLATWINEFAIPNGIDDRAIDFIKIHGTEVVGFGSNLSDGSGGKLKKSNIRLWTKYFKVLQAVDNWYEKMDQVILLAGANFPEAHVTLFVNYLKKLYESIPTNEEVMDTTKTMKTVGKLIEKSIKNSSTGSIRADISALFYQRLLTYTLANCDGYTVAQTNRLRDLILHGVNSHCMHMDLLLVVLKKLTDKQKFLETVINDDIREIFSDERVATMSPSAISAPVEEAQPEVVDIEDGPETK